MKNKTYSIKLPENPNAVFFINGIIARSGKGRIWLWRNIFHMRKTLGQAEGVIQARGGIVNSKEVMLTSWWGNISYLNKFMKTEQHRQWMNYLLNNPEELSLYNETYEPKSSGKYFNDPNGMALLFEKE